MGYDVKYLNIYESIVYSIEPQVIPTPEGPVSFLLIINS